ncbi:MAG: hypothetical protein EPO13_11565 [Actinomycetota bacterium]|nr:MAG: hypothetical protein EPO13_11565 [Actinomycetota bacterium]
MGRLPGSAASRSGLSAVIRSPLVWVLGLAAIFDGLADNPVHAVVLGGAAVLVGRDAAAADTVEQIGAPLLGSRRRALTIGIGLGVVGYAVVVGSAERYSWPPTVAVALLGAAAIALAWRRPLVERVCPPPVSRATVLAWSAVFVTAAVWELQALFQQPTLQQGSADHPTLSVLADELLHYPVVRVVALAGWLALGWFLLSRIPSRVPPIDLGPDRGGAA